MLKYLSRNLNVKVSILVNIKLDSSRKLAMSRNVSTNHSFYFRVPYWDGLGGCLPLSR